MRPNFKTLVIVVLAFLVVPLPATTQTPPASVATERIGTDSRLGMTVVATSTELPLGDWQVASVTPATAIDQVFLVPRLAPEELLGRRGLEGEMRRLAATAHYRLEFLYAPLVEYASTHKGVGPKALTELDPQGAPFVDEVLFSPWPEDANRVPRVPYAFLIPNTRISTANAFTPAAARIPLLLELRPYQNDGRHWVLFSNGDLERVAIDRAIVEKYKLTIAPVQLRTPTAARVEPRVMYTLVALRRDVTATAVTVALAEASSSQRRDLRWTLKGGTADGTLLQEWAQARALQWSGLAMTTESPILHAWLNRTTAIYGGSAVEASNMRQMMRNEQMAGGARSASAFDLLGGRAALRETLQLELIRGREMPGRDDPAVVPVSSLKGVEVTSLPFDRMLAGRPGGRIALADYVPEDRLLIYFAKPSAVFPFLNQGGDLLGRAGSTITATAYDDDLKRRYLRRLGLPEDGSRKLLESGAITELALSAPDLFFIDGTDLTVLMRLRAPETAVAFGVLAGVDLSGTAITEKRTTSGRSAYWTRQGDVLALSTNRRELERAMRLGQTASGSLGKSAELRYMLTELPLRTETRALIYLSDAFIRRMVGPAVKIGQLRRVRAAAEMTLITAGALLYKLDGHTDVPVIATLEKLGYVPAGLARPDYRLLPDCSVVSQKWGTLAELTTLETAAIDVVTQGEASAYQTYLEEYGRYWRQFFDPIAMRLDDAPDGALEVSTFILPLVASDLYNALRGVIQTRESGKPLRVPQTTPPPVLQVSLNLSDDAWVGMSSGFREIFSQFTGISPELFDMLGPGLHIGVQDADPVISLGTADLLGAFGASTSGPRMDIAIPFVLSLLTRPCKIFLELQDPARAVTLMRRAASAGPGHQRDLDVSFRQIGNGDAWTYTFSVPGVARFRLGLAIQNGYLVISNIPWSDAMTIDRVDTRPLNSAAIQARPDAVKLGLPGLFATQTEQDQTAALTSMAALLPLLQTIATTPAEAAAKHAALFGATPLHPGAGNWLWTNGRLESSTYGSATRWKAPAFDSSLTNFGLFNGAMLLDLTMQLEQGGLRAIARWQWRDVGAGR